MYVESVTRDRAPKPTGSWHPTAVSEHDADRHTLFRERTWRESPRAGGTGGGIPTILASRWTDERTAARHESSTGASDRYVIGVALRPARVRLGRGSGAAFEGTMPTGMIHVTEPGQVIDAEFFSPCDFIHFHVASDYLRGRQVAAASVQGSLRDLMVRDDLAARLSRTLTENPDGADPLYAQSVGQTILMRVLATRTPTARVGALPKWRLRRVQEHLAANISEPISLADLAAAAGLSRMHFAAQFRVATGCRPHDYLLQHRIEHAKQMLVSTRVPVVEVALSVGFQTQSHFSTVFKRLTGDTPARWKRAQRVQ